MKEAFVNEDTAVEIKDVPIPEPGPGEVLIKVVVAGTNPKDWKVPLWTKRTHNSGDDVSGTVEKVGPGVFGFAKGTRVAAFHVMTKDHGAFAEYALAPSHAVFPIPDSLSDEEAATVPLAAYTAAVALFHELEFPSPWDAKAKPSSAASKKRPLIIYGASSAVGAFAIKLAKAANIHPIIAVGSKNSQFVASSLDAAQGDALLDYTAYKSADDLVAAIKAAVTQAGVTGGRAYDALDAISESPTFETVSKAIAGPPDEKTGRRPRITVVLPGKDYSAVDSGVDVTTTSVGLIFRETEAEKLFGTIWGSAFSRGLGEGWLTGHPYEAAAGGLNGLEAALKGLRDGTVRAKKMVIRIAETK